MHGQPVFNLCSIWLQCNNLNLINLNLNLTRSSKIYTSGPYASVPAAREAAAAAAPRPASRPVTQAK
jgi:hypothetical protein